ncbi:Ppx/GppA phosphatase family protein [Schwartzia sp. (in: firmicutes)]
MIQAVIDIGSNTVRMALYEISSGAPELLLKRKQIVGLASYVKDGVMQDEGIEKAVEVLTDFRLSLERLSIKNIAAFTTAALRNAKNSAEAVSRIERESGVSIRVLSGDEEALFDFVGATHDVEEPDGLLIDIGGGSTELVLYENHEIKRQVSLPIGSLALRTGNVEATLPTPAEVESMRRIARKELSLEDWKGITVPVICAIGGTFKGARAVYNACYPCPEPTCSMDTEKLSGILSRFSVGEKIPEAELLLLLRADPDRIHTLLPGLVIAEALFEHFGVKRAVYSDSGVREGFLYSEIIPKLK